MDVAQFRHVGTLDVVIVAILLGGIALGLAQGVIRQLFFLASVYFGMVLAAQYYQLAARGLAVLIPGGEAHSYGVVGLLVVFALVAAGINGLCYLSYRQTGLPIIASAERFAGAGLGLVSAWVFVSLLVTAVDFSLSVRIVGMEDTQATALRLMNNSLLVSTLHQSMPTLYGTIRPWLPSGLPAPFSVL